MNTNTDADKTVQSTINNQNNVQTTLNSQTFPVIPQMTFPLVNQTISSPAQVQNIPVSNLQQNISAERPPLIESPKTPTIPPSQPITHQIRQEFDTSHTMFPPYFNSMTSPGFTHLGQMRMQTTQSPYQLYQQRLPFARAFVNGCGAYPQPHSLIERAKFPNNGHPPQMAKISNSNIDHNYTGNLERSMDRSSFNSQNFQNISGIKRNSSVSSLDFLNNNIEAPNEPAPKKKRHYQVSKEAIQKALSLGFQRNLVKIPGENGEIKKFITYIAPDGTELPKKSDIKTYLFRHPEIDLKNDNFSYDTRLSLNPPKKRESIPKPVSQTPENSKSLTSPKIPKSKNRPRKSEDPCASPTKASLRKIGPKNRKIIAKYFKKLSDDNKYFEGLSPGNYRRKIPAFPKITLTFPANFSFEELCSIFQDILTIFEFINNFSEKFDLKTKFETITDCASVLIVSDLEGSKFFKLLRELLSLALSLDNFSNEINSNFHLDNVMAFEWNWLIVHEIFKIYLESKSKIFKTILPLQECIYFKNLEGVLNSLSNQEYIYFFKKTLKAFSIRFLIDQIVASNTFSTFLNDKVEILAKTRRDKSQCETRMKHLRAKIGASNNNVVKSPESAKLSGDENGNEIQPDEDSQGLPALISELGQLELDRDRYRDEISKNMFLVRAVHLGSDRHDREYVYIESQSAIFVEGLTSQVGIAEQKFPFTSSIHDKIKYPDSDSLDQLLYVSDQVSEKIDENLKEFKFDIFEKYFSESETENSVINIKNENVTPFYDSHNPTLNVLIHFPRLIKSVTEEDFDQLIDVFNKNFAKHIKVSTSNNEYGLGWWHISDQTTLNELSKSLNQKGLKEQNLHKSINRASEFISWKSEQNDPLNPLTFKVEIASQISNGEIIKNGNSLLISEINQLSAKMDKFLQKMNVEIEKPFEEMIKEYLKEPDVNIKQVVRQTIEIFLEKTDKKFDRIWYSKWLESFDACASLPSLYILFLSFKIKLDPNSKICKICQTVNEDLAVCECGICQFSAHESCLQVFLYNYSLL